MHEHGISPAAVAELPVRLRRHAMLEPAGGACASRSRSTTCSHRALVCPPIHKLEAPPWSDGAACVLVAVGRAGRRKRHVAAVAALTGWGEAPRRLQLRRRSRPASRATPGCASRRSEALAHARRTLDERRRRRGVRGVRRRGAHDVRGDGPVRARGGAAAVARGETSLGGRIPVNTSGGRLSLGHPPQATPLLELQEVCEQLTAEADGTAGRERRGRARAGRARRDERVGGRRSSRCDDERSGASSTSCATWAPPAREFYRRLARGRARHHPLRRVRRPALPAARALSLVRAGNRLAAALGARHRARVHAAGARTAVHRSARDRSGRAGGGCAGVRPARRAVRRACHWAGGRPPPRCATCRASRCSRSGPHEAAIVSALP